MAGKIPKRTPEEQAAYDERTRQGLAYLERLHDEVERERALRARREERRRRRLLTLGLSS